MSYGDLFVLFWVLVAYIGAGIYTLKVWGDLFDDISNRTFKVTIRLAMVLLWPLWFVCVIVMGFVALAGYVVFELWDEVFGD